ncbi:TonB-dependent receptor plug domain-containing protein [Pseudoalteromonas phenolica]|uniref:Putative porin protein n=1 Tax=Pseudoalteromonas phenolica TaxID=161398 RepID=A0A0S2K303_9GAMM|nr:TonB-dependent receptor plug domain-containing protein [Pseudoalteromonas phenolica]ALO42699.1 putative porin protein [Pseudoalteromonas phenolica]MBE0356194.1 hypothetical protein [Pseudoalteromonas phenolica O-BC30]
MKTSPILYVSLVLLPGLSLADTATELAPELKSFSKTLIAECVGKTALEKKNKQQLLECLESKKRAQNIERIDVKGQYIGLQVPEVSGRYTLDRDFLEKTPHTAGDISELLGLLPGVLLGSDAFDADQQAEIGAKRVSISGAQPWQTGFFIDGVNFNSRQDPSAYDRSKSTPNDVQGAVQAFNVNQQIVESLEVYTNNIPANYGGFSGGVVEVNTREAEQNERHLGFSYRTSQSDWNQYHVIIDEETGQEVEELPLSPVFEKNVYNFDLSLGLGEHHSLLVATSFTESKISEVSLNQTAVTSRENTNFLVKLTQKDLFLDKVDLTFNYSPYESQDIIKDVLNSEFNNDGGGYSTTLKLEQDVAGIGLSSKFSYTFSENSRQAPAHFYPWRKAKGKDWGVGDAAEDISHSREGGYGTLDKEQETLFWELNADFDEVSLFNIGHYFKAGIQVQKETLNRQRYDASYRYNSPNAQLSNLNCAGALFDCVELQTSMSIEELEAKLGEPLDLSKPEHVLHYSNIVTVTPQFFTLRTVYQAEQIEVDVQNLSAYFTDEFEWHNLTLRLGLRYDHDDVLEHHNLAPRISGGYRLGEDEETMVVFGANRYYDSNLLNYKIREQQLPSILQQRYAALGGVQGWQDQSTQTDYRYRYNEVDTPFSDELVLGWKQATQFGNYSIEYVKRWGKKQLSSTQAPQYNSDDGYYYRQLSNLGYTQNERVSLSWALYLNAHSFWANSTYQLAQYSNTDSYENVDTAALNELVFLRTGDVNSGYEFTETTKNNIELRSEEFGEPLTVNLGWTAKWTPTFTTSLNASYRQSYQAILPLNTSRESEQLSRACPQCAADDSLLIDVYQEVQLPSRVLANLSLNWEPKLLKDHNLKFGLDIKNLFDSRTYTAYGESVGIETGRSIWLSVGVKL